MTNNLIPGKIAFIENHIPTLKDGDYEIKLTQTISGSGITERPHTLTKQFTVAGPRFRINPDEIYTVFPPEGSLGDHANVLPHIVLNRSTLPWERPLWAKIETANDPELNHEKFPWLALLVFHDDEVQHHLVSAPFTCSLTKDGAKQWQLVRNAVPDDGQPKPKDHDGEVPNLLTLESGQTVGDQVTAIDVRADLLASIIPSANALYWSAHVRQRKDKHEQPLGDEKAVVVATRLPKKGGTSTVHLVSLERSYGNYSQISDPTAAGVKDVPFPSANSGKFVRLISLKSWQFACSDPRYNFHQLLRHLNHEQEHLFSTDIRFLDQFAHRPVSPELKEIFSTNKHPLTATSPSLTQVDGMWILTDGVKQYGLKERSATEVAVHEWCADKRPSLQSTTYFTFAKTILKKGLNVTATQEIKDPEKTGPFFSDQAIVEDGDIEWVVADKGQRYYLKGEDNQLKVYRIGPNMLRLPFQENAPLESFYARGYTPLPHTTRQAEKTVSWYHSPFLPSKPTNRPVKIDQRDVAIRTSDELLAYDPNLKLYDVAYAAAWKIGRLLGLQDKRFSLELFHWKRGLVQHSQRQKRLAAHAYLSSAPPAPPPNLDQLQETIDQWLANLNLLKGVPFNYLVPDEQMLPPESIRFFYMDTTWLEALLDGAFSVGRVSESDRKRDAVHHLARNRYGQMTGFLLRSHVVSGWPDLHIDGFSKLVNDTVLVPDPASRLKIIRREKLSNDILLCIFEEEVKTVDIHLEPEALHFGLTSNDADMTFYKMLRDRSGIELEKKDDTGEVAHIIVKPVQFRDTAELIVRSRPAPGAEAEVQQLKAKIAQLKGQGLDSTAQQKELKTKELTNKVQINGVVNMVQLVEDMRTTLNNYLHGGPKMFEDKEFTAAQFALQMIEGVDMVRFRADAA